MTTVYEVNGRTGKIAAAKDPIFGWSISINDGGWEPLEYGHPFSSDTLRAIRECFMGIAYPHELKEALFKAYGKRKTLEAEIDEREAALAQERDDRLALAAANAVSPVEEELRKLKKEHNIALNKLAVQYLRYAKTPDGALRQNEDPRVMRVIGLAMDNCLELSLRKMGYGERFLGYKDCQVTVTRPTDPELHHLLDGVLPFTK